MNTSGLGVPIFRYYKWLKGLIMALLFLNTQLFAAPFSGAGSGTVGDPYQIVTPVHLNEVRNSLSSHYKLMNDIDLTTYLANGGDGYTAWGTSGWMPLGHSGTGSTYTNFSGTFEGNFKKISGLFINRNTLMGVGLFASVGGGSKISNLKIDLSGDIVGLGTVGSLTGTSTGIIHNCHVTSTSGMISAGTSGVVGGLIGTVGNEINASSAQVNVTSTGTSVGGLIGVNGAHIKRSFATGNVIGTNSLGGLVGYMSGTASISDSYSIGSVTSSTDSYYVAGFVGNPDTKQITNSYSVGGVTTSYGNASYKGAFTGNANATPPITNSYYNADTSIITTNPNAGVTSSTTAEMQAQPTTIYTGWDFTNVWEWKAGSGVYPTIIPVVGWETVVSTPSMDTHLIYKHGSMWSVNDNGRYIATNTADITTIPLSVVDGNISKPTGATIQIFSSSNVEKTSGNLAVGDYVKVTAEDGITTRIYLVFGIKPQVATGDYHTLILSADGKVYSFGYGEVGQLGHGNTNSISTPTKIVVAGDNNITAITAGTYHSLLLDTEGNVYSFGEGAGGRLGHGDEYMKTTPTKIVGVSNIVAISASADHTLLLDKEGKVYSFGEGAYGKLGHGDTANKTTPTQIVTAGENNITAISAGTMHSLLLDKEGKVYSFGSAPYIGIYPTNPNDNNTTPTQIVTAGENNITAISTFGGHSLLLNKNGKVYSFGNGNYGRLGHGDELQKDIPTQIMVAGDNNITTISAGREYTILLDKNGQAYGFGNNNESQLGLCDTTARYVPTELNSGSCLFVDVIADTTSPTVSSQGATNITNTTAKIFAQSDEDGTLYYIVTTSAASPTIAQVKTGKDGTGANAFLSGNRSITADTNTTFDITGLTSGVQYRYYFLSTDGSDNNSSLAGGFVTTTSSPVITSTPTLNLQVGTSYTYSPIATDSDNDTLTWAIKDGTTLPTWLSVNYINDGIVSLLAGSTIAGSTNGIGGSASFMYPRDMAFDDEGNIFIVDTGNYRIRKMTMDGNVSTFVGSVNGTANGIGTSATFNSPYSIVKIPNGGFYVADTTSGRIRHITIDGNVTTLSLTDTNGNPISYLNQPRGMVIDSNGNIFVAENIGGHTIKKITPQGVVSLFAGTSGTSGNSDGMGINVKFNSPNGLAIDSQNNLYLTDTANCRIRKITPDGNVSTLAGSSCGFADGNGTNAKFDEPTGIAINIDGSLLVTDFRNYRIRKVTFDGNVTTFAGNGTPGIVNGEILTANFKNPLSIKVKQDGTIVISEQHAIRIIKSKLVSFTGTPTTQGMYDVNLTLTDGTNEVAHNFQITVTEPINGTCGSANNSSFTAAPSANLCSTGEGSSVTIGSANYIWNCTGVNNGTTASCSATKAYTVTFDTNGGNSIASQTILYNTTATLPSAPTKIGYTFVGWYGESGLVTSFDFATHIIVNTTLYAKWSANVIVPTPINGTCGTSNGIASLIAPSANLCSTGTASNVTTGSTNYTWNCAGLNSGITASCSATIQTQTGGTDTNTTTPTDNNTSTGGTEPNTDNNTTTEISGICGISHGITLKLAPSTNLCKAGTSTTVTINTGRFGWSCMGSNGGVNVECNSTQSVKDVTNGNRTIISGVIGTTETTDINGTKLDVNAINENNQTIFIEAELPSDINSTIKTKHKVSIGGKETIATSQLEATVDIKSDKSVETRATINGSQISVTAKANGTAEHIVSTNGKTSKATSNIIGAQTQIEADGTVETMAGDVNATEVGYLIKAVAITDAQGRTITRFIKIKADDPTDVTPLGNTIKSTTSFEAGSNVEIEDISGILYMKIEAPLSNTNLIIE